MINMLDLRIQTQKASSCHYYLITVEVEAQTSALKSHYEGRLGQLQKELDTRPPQTDSNVESQTEIEKLKKENAELVQKVCGRIN